MQIQFFFLVWDQAVDPGFLAGSQFWSLLNLVPEKVGHFGVRIASFLVARFQCRESTGYTRAT